MPTNEDIFRVPDALNEPTISAEPTPATPTPEPATEPVTAPVARTGDEARKAYEAMKAAEVERQRVEDERKKAEFVKQVMEARNQPEPEHKPQPIPPRLAEQTRREMEEGARQNQRHAEFHAQNPMPRGHNPMGDSQPVFRPADYVPNFDQGDVKARNTR